MKHPIPGGNFTGGKNLEALSLGGELPQNVQSFLEAVPSIDADTLQSLHQARLARREEIVPRLPEDYPFDTDIDITSEQYLTGLCVEAFANSDAVKQADFLVKVRDIDGYEEFCGLIASKSVDLRYATFGPGSKIYYSETLGESTNPCSFDFMDGKCNGLALQLNIITSHFTCNLAGAEVEECVFSGLARRNKFDELGLLDVYYLSRGKENQFSDCKLGALTGNIGDQFVNCVVSSLRIRNPDIYYKGKVYESLSFNGQVGGTRIEIDRTGTEGLGLGIYEEAEGIVFLENMQNFGVKNLYWGKEGFVSMSGSVLPEEINMALVPTGEGWGIFDFSEMDHKSEGNNLSFLSSLDFMGKMLEYLKRQKDSGEYADNEDVNTLLSRGYRIRGPANKMYNVNIGENGKSFIEVRDTDDGEYRRVNNLRRKTVRLLEQISNIMEWLRRKL